MTAQNTQKVFAIHNSPIDFLRQQIEVVLADIKFDAIKIGMLGNQEIIDCVADVINKKAKKIPLILDPVMVATSGDLLLQENAVVALKTKLLKKSFIATPNIDEAQVLIGKKITTISDMKNAATLIKKMGAKSVLVKGGHLATKNKITSVLLDENDKFHLISNPRFGQKNIHGTGCTLATAIACNIAKKLDLVKAVRNANSYVYRSITKSLKIGQGSLILQHF